MRRRHSSFRISWQRATSLTLFSIALLTVAPAALFGAASAQENSSSTPSTAASSSNAAVNIELNKLEAEGQNCRAYFVVNNKSDTEYQGLKLDLVLFRSDGVIGRRFAVDLAPLKAEKQSVKLFDIEGTKCDEVGSFLINDIMECKAASGPVTDCLKNISVSTRTEVQLNK